jgi:uncharacterized protein (DUF2235 family)
MGELVHQLTCFGRAWAKRANPRGLWRIGRALQMGDRIYMFGYSRGAFVVRSLSGIIDRVGLLRSEFATSRYVDRVWRRYRESRRSEDFKSRYCHGDVKINMMGIYHTVSVLSLNLPWFAQILPDNYSFHNHRIFDCVLAGYHALALDETRAAYAPERWEADETGVPHEMEQVWFSGSHADVGSFVGARSSAAIGQHSPDLDDGTCRAPWSAPA